MQQTCQLGLCSHAYGNDIVPLSYRSDFWTEKLTVFTRVQSIIVPVLGPVHTDTASYRSDAFLAKTSKRKSDMSTNFKHCRIRSNFYLKLGKNEKK